MKNSLFKGSLIAALSLSTSLGTNNHTFYFSSNSLIEAVSVIRNTRFFSHLFAMGTDENLKAYHIGLKYIFPNYQIPSVQNLLDTIRSHSRFVGFLSQDEAWNRCQTQENRYFIFEEKGNVPGHFYIAYSQKLRHFTVNKKEIAGIHNGHSVCYPGLNRLLQSTFAI